MDNSNFTKHGLLIMLNGLCLLGLASPAFGSAVSSVSLSVSSDQFNQTCTNPLGCEFQTGNIDASASASASYGNLAIHYHSSAFGQGGLIISDDSASFTDQILLVGNQDFAFVQFTLQAVRASLNSSPPFVSMSLAGASVPIPATSRPTPQIVQTPLIALTGNPFTVTMTLTGFGQNCFSCGPQTFDASLSETMQFFDSNGSLITSPQFIVDAPADLPEPSTFLVAMCGLGLLLGVKLLKSLVA